MKSRKVKGHLMQKCILVIEDDTQIRFLLRKNLESEGYRVLEAENGSVGITLYQQNAVDLVITDLIMPEKEGIETIRELKKLNAHVKIIAMSGGGAIEPTQYLSMAQKLGVLKTFTKPFLRNDILTAVKELL